MAYSGGSYGPGSNGNSYYGHSPPNIPQHAPQPPRQSSVPNGYQYPPQYSNPIGYPSQGGSSAGAGAGASSHQPSGPPQSNYQRPFLPHLQPLASSTPMAQQAYQLQNQNHRSYSQNQATSFSVPAPILPSFQMQTPQVSQAPQAQQFINPSQLFQQSSRSCSQPYPTPGASVATATVQYAAMASRRPAAPVEIDRSKLAVALAEEYFDAAHKIAPAASMSMPAKALEEYHKLIAAGLGLLEATLRRGGMTPREEANMRLRYCSVLFEETENSMEAETALSQGITICERNHYFDLKYALQFLLAQIMFKKNPKAGLRALDAHIADAEAYQHIPWVYAFRFLRASLSLASPVPADKWKGNFEKITTLATQQNDYGIRLASCLMEALAYLKYGGPDSIEAVQGAIAAAWSYQAQPSCQIPQLIALLHMIDTTCSIRQGSPEVMMTKLRAMQRMIDAALADEESWGFTDDSIAIPMSRSAHSSQVVSSDTRSVLGIGRDGGDKLMMSFLHKRDAYAITYLLGSLVLFNKDAETGKAAKYLYSGLETIGSAKKKDMPMYDTLPNCVSRNQWRSQIACYYTSCLAFIAAAKCEWTAVKIQVEKLNSAMKDLGDGNVGPLNSVALYLSGIYHQGTGDLDAALPIFQDKVFDLSIYENVTSSAAQLQKDYALLAAFNTILICQEPGRKDPQRNNKLVGKMTEACLNHQSPDVRTASKILSVTVLRSPPMSSIDVRGHLSMALKGAKISGNLHFTSLALSIMCSRFFVDVVGLQAEKSALAASAQAHRSHNALWISVADGMLGNVHELNGNSGEAHRALARARQYADAAFPHP